MISLEQIKELTEEEIEFLYNVVNYFPERQDKIAPELFKCLRKEVLKYKLNNIQNQLTQEGHKVYNSLKDKIKIE